MKKASKKNSKNKSIKVWFQKTNLALALFVALSLLIGVVIGYVLNQPHDVRYGLANNSQIKSIKQQITKQYQADSSTNCSDETDPIKPGDRVEVFNDYLKVNKYGNRAVIRGCNDIDTLLARNPINGNWESTMVNISLDTRANPSWQIECIIDDITTADDVVRPENSSIDTTNLVLCRQLKEREQVVAMLLDSGVYERSEITQEDVDSYIKGAEEFSRF